MHGGGASPSAVASSNPITSSSYLQHGAEHLYTGIYVYIIVINLCMYAQQGWGHIGLYVCIFVYLSTNKQAVYCLTAQKSPAECILLLSP